DPRILDLGHRLTDDKPTERAKVEAVTGYLSRGFTYSLDPLEGDSTDPLARFLFDAKKGHCELYASAVAVLLRVGGLKTRVATGYCAGQWNSVGGYLAFAQQDAHAWAEVYLPDQGWRWVDATPADLRSRRSAGVLSMVIDFYQALDAYWYDHVVDYDAQRQRQ